MNELLNQKELAELLATMFADIKRLTGVVEALASHEEFLDDPELQKSRQDLIDSVKQALTKPA